jgi:glucosamine--fructose-6-phosphate aminotransferase (isomerizing)
MTSQMAREIAEQPAAVRRTFEALLPLRDDIRGLFDGRRRVLFVARGSSDNAAVYGRYLLEVHAGVNSGLASPSVGTHYRTRLDLRDALVVCVSQSGSTQEIVDVEAWARACGGRTIAVTNVEQSPLAESADLALVTQAGPELAVPATKTYLTQLVAMTVLATALSPDTSALDADLHRVADEVEKLVAQRSGVSDAAAALAAAESVVVSGRGLVLGTALETALKLEETCLRPVRGYSYADLRHGPISVVTEGVVAVLLAAKDGPLTGAMVDVAGDLAGRGAATIGIGGNAAFEDAVSLHVPGPDLPESLAPLGLVVPAQMFIEELARMLNLDPDSPRGLRKVTQTDAEQ